MKNQTKRLIKRLTELLEKYENETISLEEMKFLRILLYNMERVVSHVIIAEEIESEDEE